MALNLVYGWFSLYRVVEDQGVALNLFSQGCLCYLSFVSCLLPVLSLWVIFCSFFFAYIDFSFYDLTICLLFCSSTARFLFPSGSRVYLHAGLEASSTQVRLVCFF